MFFCSHTFGAFFFLDSWCEDVFLFLSGLASFLFRAVSLFHGGKTVGIPVGSLPDGSRVWCPLFPPSCGFSHVVSVAFQPSVTLSLIFPFIVFAHPLSSILVSSLAFLFLCLICSISPPFFFAPPFPSHQASPSTAFSPRRSVQAPSRASSRSPLLGEGWLLSLGSALIRLPLANRPVSTIPGSPVELARGPLPDVQTGSSWVVPASDSAMR